MAGQGVRDGWRARPLTNSFGSCVVIPNEKKGSTDRIAVRALWAFVRSVAQPRMVLQCDSEPAIIDVV